MIPSDTKQGLEDGFPTTSDDAQTSSGRLRPKKRTKSLPDILKGDSSDGAREHASNKENNIYS